MEAEKLMLVQVVVEFYSFHVICKNSQDEEKRNYRIFSSWFHCLLVKIFTFTKLKDQKKWSQIVQPNWKAVVVEEGISQDRALNISKEPNENYLIIHLNWTYGSNNYFHDPKISENCFVSKSEMPF